MEISPLTLKLSARLFSRDGKCFGPGVAELLERIEQEGSLRAAAAGMGMAYSNAWTVLRGCEQALGFPLLARKTGGRAGGRSELTPKARILLKGYRELEERLVQMGDTLLAEVLASVADEKENETEAGS